MIKVQFLAGYADGCKLLTVEMEVLPRIGEKVDLGPDIFTITDIYHYVGLSDYDVHIECQSRKKHSKLDFDSKWIDGSPVDETSQET